MGENLKGGDRLYRVEGFWKKNGMYVKEEFYPEPGMFWESVKDLDDVTID